jgi:O-antigen/teichoic acid export membrane protein
MRAMTNATGDPAPVGAAPRGTARRRASLVTFDQGVSSASNLLPLLWVAHVLTPADFGRFSLVFLVYVFAQTGVVRSLGSATVVVHPEDADECPRDVVGSVVLLSLVPMVLCIVGGLGLWWYGSSMGPALVVVGVAMPLLGVQDVGRYIGIAESRPGRAVLLDALWLGFMVVAFVVVSEGIEPTLTRLVAAWAVTGALSGLWVFVQHGVPRGREMSADWLRRRWHFSWRSLVASSSTATVALLGSALMAIVSGPVAVAAVRAALLLERPSTALQTAVATSAAADIAREQPDNAGLVRHQRRTMSLSVAVAALNMLVVLLIPDAVGHALLGKVWDTVQPLLLAIGFHVATLAAQSGVRAVLIGRRMIGPVMVVDIVGTVLAITGMVVGAALGDAEGAMWGTVVGQALTVVMWWGALARHLATPYVPDRVPANPTPQP